MKRQFDKNKKNVPYRKQKLLREAQELYRRKEYSKSVKAYEKQEETYVPKQEVKLDIRKQILYFISTKQNTGE
jgi:hypothetical protein